MKKFICIILSLVFVTLFSANVSATLPKDYKPMDLYAFEKEDDKTSLIELIDIAKNVNNSDKEIVACAIERLLKIIENEELEYDMLEEIIFIIYGIESSEEAIKIAKYLLFFQGQNLDEELIVLLLTTPHENVNELAENLTLISSNISSNSFEENTFEENLDIQKEEYKSKILFENVAEMSEVQKKEKIQELIDISKKADISVEEIFDLSYACYELTNGGRDVTLKEEMFEIYNNVSDKLNPYYWTYFQYMNAVFLESWTSMILNYDDKIINEDVMAICINTDSESIANNILSRDDGILYAFYMLQNENLNIKEIAKQKMLKTVHCIQPMYLRKAFNESLKTMYVQNEFIVEYSRQLFARNEEFNSIYTCMLLVDSPVEALRACVTEKLLKLIEQENLKYNEIFDIIVLIIDDMKDSEDALKIAKKLFLYHGEKFDLDLILFLSDTCHDAVNAFISNLINY